MGGREGERHHVARIVLGAGHEPPIVRFAALEDENLGFRIVLEFRLEKMADVPKRIMLQQAEVQMRVLVRRHEDEAHLVRQLGEGEGAEDANLL